MGRTHRIGTLLLAGALGLAGGSVMAEDELLTRILESHDGLRPVLERAEELRLQVALGLVEEGENGRPALEQHTFRAGAEYFYPASTVKLFAAVAAVQKITQIRDETGYDIDLDTPMIVHPLFDDDVVEKDDPDNLETGSITVRQEIREIFLVSDNRAYNTLYEMVGQDGLAASLAGAGLDRPRIVHRLSEFRTPEEHRQLPKIVFVGRDFKHTLPERTTEPLPATESVDRLLIGRAYYAGDELIEEPMDFSTKNYFPLVDLQRGLCKLVRPDVDCGGPPFELEDEDRQVMLEAMSQYPRQSTNPVYDPEEYPDDYVKDLLPGLIRVVPKKQITIFNKTGQAYGFSTENAWVVHTKTGEGFFLAATIYTNADETLNDDEYEYDEIARPFMADLGEAVARNLWGSSIE
jgi:hypothetical protein